VGDPGRTASLTAQPAQNTPAGIVLTMIE